MALEFPSVDHLSTLTVVICAIESPSDYSHNSRWKAIRHHGGGAFRSTFLWFSLRDRVRVGIQSRKMSRKKNTFSHARTRTKLPVGTGFALTVILYSLSLSSVEACSPTSRKR